MEPAPLNAADTEPVELASRKRSLTDDHKSSSQEHQRDQEEEEEEEEEEGEEDQEEDEGEYESGALVGLPFDPLSPPQEL